MEQAEQEQKNQRRNPREESNIFGILTFWYTRDLFRVGYNKVLAISDLYKPLKEDESGILGDRLEKHWNEQLKHDSKNPSLIKAIFKTFWREYAILGVINFGNDIIVRLTQPIFLGLLLSYFTPGSAVTKNEALFSAAAIVIMNSLNSISTNQFIFQAFSNGMKVRLATCSLIYRKSLRLSSTALGHTSVGKVVNLLSNDVSRFDVCSFFVHSMWVAPLLTLIVGIIIYSLVGTPGLIGMIVIAIVTPIQSFTGTLSSRFRLQTALRTDERVRLMDEVISGIQVIKLYAWEKSFKKLIYFARDKELKVIRNSSYVRGLYMTFMLFTTRSALFCTMMAIVLLGDQLSASKVFVVSQYFSIIANVMSQMFVRGIAEIAEALVSIRRIRAFLMYEEQDQLELPKQKADLMMKFNRSGDVHEKEKLVASEFQISSNVALSIRNISCRWKTAEESLKGIDKTKKERNGIAVNRKPSTDPNNFNEADELKLTLNNISLEVPQGSLVGVLGHVGSGKSSLLQAILKELPTESGTLIVRGKVSFASQEPWVFSGSVRQNIVFGQPEFDELRYEEVVECCALKQDFSMFEFGDRTLIGERGSSLSGGQKARVSLARALYRKADLYLLDDPLSAVDAHVGKHLFDRCISNTGFLGKQNASVILVTHQVHFLQKANWAVIMKDGMIERQGRPEDLAKAGVDLMKIAEESEEIQRKRSMSRSLSRSSSISENDRIDDERKSDLSGSDQAQPKNVEEISKGKVKGNIVWNYMRTGGNSIKLLIAIFLFIFTQVIASASDYWVGFWSRQEELKAMASAPSSDTGNSTQSSNKFIEEPIFSSENLVYIAGSLIVALFIVGIIRSIFFYTITVNASRNLHAKAFDGVVSTKMRFFDLNPSGRILNRFSKDFGQIDEWLPKCILDASQVLLTTIGAVVVTSVINPMVLIPLAFFFVLFIMIQRYYLKTSKNIKRLEGTTKSHAFVHLAATINGLSTVRAFGAQEVLIKEFDQHQNLHTGAFYMFISCSQAFGFALDILCMFFVSFVTFYFLIFEKREFNGASVGLAITQSMALTLWLQWGVRQSAEVLNQMMAVERVLEYRELEKEEKDNQKESIENAWPQDGNITFNNVTYRYAADMDPALRDVNFHVKSSEKIGIVGRTGAGKSSLIGSLFRIAEIEGNILIDKVDTANVTLEQLRSRLSIIPQDPVLFSGSMRKNLDPFEEYPDDSIWKALEEVKLKDIPGLKLMGLQTLVATGGSNFSVGQRQLICLARAILRNNKILVLDEATANVDPETDHLIQETIREKFANCTVMTIAHRLHTVMDSDKILVMNFGRVAEFDTPLKLLEKEDGIFASMVKATGNSESLKLIEIAKRKKK